MVNDSELILIAFLSQTTGTIFITPKGYTESGLNNSASWAKLHNENNKNVINGDLLINLN